MDYRKHCPICGQRDFLLESKFGRVCVKCLHLSRATCGVRDLSTVENLRIWRNVEEMAAAALKFPHLKKPDLD